MTFNGTERLVRAARELARRLRGLNPAELPLDALYRDRFLREKMDMLDSSLIRSQSRLAMALDGRRDGDRCILVNHSGESRCPWLSTLTSDRNTFQHSTRL